MAAVQLLQRLLLQTLWQRIWFAKINKYLNFVWCTSWGGGIGKFNLNVVNKAASICKQPHRIQISSTRGIGSEGPSPTPAQFKRLQWQNAKTWNWIHMRMWIRIESSAAAVARHALVAACSVATSSFHAFAIWRWTFSSLYLFACVKNYTIIEAK